MAKHFNYEITGLKSLLTNFTHLDCVEIFLHLTEFCKCFRFYVFSVQLLSFLSFFFFNMTWLLCTWVSGCCLWYYWTYIFSCYAGWILIISVVTHQLCMENVNLHVTLSPSVCSCIPSPHCTGHWTPPPGPWGSFCQHWSGSEPHRFWCTGWCGPRSFRHLWCAPAAHFPLPGGTLGSHWHHESR